MRSSFLQRTVALLAFLAAAGLSACKGGDGGGTTPTGSFSLDVSPASGSGVSGNTVGATITISRSGNFAGAVTLRLDNPPSGFTAAFSPTVIPAGSSSANVILSLASTVPTGNYTITIVGSAVGQADRSDSFSLAVTQLQGSFTIAGNPNALTIQQGKTGVTTVTIARVAPFTGAVNLAIESTPTGVTTSFSVTPIPVSDVSSVLTISVGATATPGAYSLTVVGTGTAVLPQTTTIALTVTADPGAITMSLNPSVFPVRQGRSGETTVQVGRVAPFTGTVALTLLDAPTGVTGVFAQATLPAGVTSTTLTLSVGAAVAPGEYILAVKGSNAAVPDVAASIRLTVTADPGSFALSVGTGDVTIPQGTSAPATATVVRTAPFTGPVALTVISIEPAAAGITASFAPTTIPTGSTTSILTVTVAASVVPANYTISVRGTGTVDPANATLLVHVTPSPGGFTLDAAPAAVRPGRIVTADISVARTLPFAGPITLMVEGVPAGITPSFTHVVVGATQTNLQITYTVLATVAPATYPITIRGTGIGVAGQQATQNLSVTAPPAPTMTFQFCDATTRPIWGGYQNGNEQWTQVVGTNGNYEMPIVADKGAVAFVSAYNGESGPAFEIVLALGTQQELIEAGNLSCLMTPAKKTLFGTIAGQGVNELVTVNVGSGFAQLMPGQGTSFIMPEAGTGLRDLFAARTTMIGAPTATKIILRRQTQYPDGGTIPLLNFESAEAVATTPQNVAVVNGGTDQLVLRQTYVTTGGTTTGQFPAFTMAGNAATYMVVPPALALTGDLYNVRIDARLAPGLPTTRAVTSTFTTPAAQVLTLGPMLHEPTTFVLQAAPFYQVRLQSTWQPEYNKSYAGRYQQATRTGIFYATAGYMGGTAVDVTTPDLTTVPGWRAEWGPIAGISTRLTAMGYGWTGTTRTLFPGWFGDVVVEPGVTLRSGILQQTVTP